MRLLREIVQSCSGTTFNSASGWRFKLEIIEVLHAAWDDFLTELNKYPNHCLIQSKLLILQSRDRKLALK